MNLVRCSCGWEAITADLQANVVDAVLPLELPAMVDHWRKGHTVKAANGLWDRIVAAAIDYAKAQGIDVDLGAIPNRHPMFRRRAHDQVADDVLADAMRRRYQDWRWR